MRRYELMLLLRPDLDDEKLQGAVEKVTRAIVNGGGSLSKVSPWGKRRLAYEINHFREASYFLIHFDIEPAAVREIERGLLISEEILLHLVTVIEERPTDEVPAEAVAGADEEAGEQADEEGDEEPETATEAAAEPEESSEGEGDTEQGDAEEQEAAATEG
jgi:small subunit ribosomal protein S6